MTTTTTHIDWNAWRSDYDTMSFAEQQAFYDLVYCLHPQQARAEVSALERFLDYIGQPLTVVELGGWDGGFAAKILERRPEIVWWTNYEISRAAATESVCEDARFASVPLEDWYWMDKHVADLFVASHVLEHLSILDVIETFDATSTRWMFLQAPLREEPTDWSDYHGSHILEVGWAVISEELSKRGYALLPELSEPHVRCYER